VTLASPKALLVFDVDGVLIDVTPSFTRIVRELSGATLEDIAVFKANGGFNDDWELARAASSWIAAGRPKVLDRVNDWRDVIAWCSHDPGDLTAECVRLYRDHYWRDEVPLVDGDLLRRLATRFDIAACTGRDRWELDRAEELLGFSFPRATTSEQVRKPDPQALLRLLSGTEPLVIMLGDTEADRRTTLLARAAVGKDVRFRAVSADAPAVAFLDELWEASDVREAADRLCEPRNR
jgi:phosphoglycolate phosphatase-like HAD superfamily hydrolase